MEDFVVSARKYRPKTFDTVIGQESITQTLLRAIEQNHLAQAFLFCGPRGVGKTSCARILARTVNQFHSDSETPEDDYAFNIFELDAASNNSVDDIRNLVDQTRIPPQIGKYKVYIIDEVHMLSQNAFNAFLKTLEEPPAYAIFILATTEKHKVLPTIISRCQVFDFNRIQIPEMVAHLSQIAKNEDIEAESDALHVIAEKADGALRDALSIFDQVVGFTGNKLTYQDVITNLNILDYDYYFEMTKAFLRGDKTEALLTFNTILNNGFDGHNFINGLADHFRNLLFCTSERTASIMEVGGNIQQRYLEQAKNCDIRFILNGLNTLSETDINYKSSKNQRLIVELALLKLCGLVNQLSQKKNVDSELTAPSEVPKQKSTATDVTKGYKNSQTGFSSDTNSKIIAEPTPQSSVEKKEDDPKVDRGEPESEEENAVSDSEKPIADQNLKADQNTENLESKEVSEINPNDSQLEESKTKESKPEQAKTPQSEETQSKNRPDKEAVGVNFKSKLNNGRSKGLPSLSALSENMNSDSATGEKKLGDDEELKNITTTLAEENRPADAFNLAQLWKVWEDYTNLIKAEEKKSYYATLTKHQPVLIDDHKVELLIDNHVQLADLEADKLRLLEFLREGLNNWKIQFEGVIDENESDDGDTLYDPHQKFDAMNAQNPKLGDLKKLFDLDVEHDG